MRDMIPRSVTEQVHQRAGRNRCLSRAPVTTRPLESRSKQERKRRARRGGLSIAETWPLHGGKITGPRTPEGLEASRRAG